MRLSEEQFERLLKSTGRKAEQKQGSRTIAGGYSSHVAFWETVGGQRKYWRSLWEYNYACYLEFLKTKGAVAEWEHEPKKFCFKDKYKRPPYDYLPDFRVVFSTSVFEWHEVKGYLNGKSKRKIQRFEKCYPNEGRVVIIDSDWFRSARNYKAVVPGWLSLEEAQAKYAKKKG